MFYRVEILYEWLKLLLVLFVFFGNKIGVWFVRLVMFMIIFFIGKYFFSNVNNFFVICLCYIYL